MGENSNIEWTTHTFNPWLGCTKVATGCQHCYAEVLMDHRYGKVQWGPNGTRVLTTPANWAKPLKWNRDAEKAGQRARVFCSSLADVFEAWGHGFVSSHSGDGSVWVKPYSEREWGRENWHTADIETMQRDPQGWQFVTLDDVRRELFALIDSTPWLDWQLLTKRPEHVPAMWPNRECPNPGRMQTLEELANWNPLSLNRRDNVWILTSVATQADADRNVPFLLKCRDLSPVLGLSMEPLVGPVDFSAIPFPQDQCPGCGGSGSYLGPYGESLVECDHTWADAARLLDWVIVGGESGHGARECNAGWIANIVDQCKAAGVPCFVKQIGKKPRHGGIVDGWPQYVTAMANGAQELLGLRDDLKGGDWSEWPESLRAREFPAGTAVTP